MGQKSNPVTPFPPKSDEYLPKITIHAQLVEIFPKINVLFPPRSAIGGTKSIWPLQIFSFEQMSEKGGIINSGGSPAQLSLGKDTERCSLVNSQRGHQEAAPVNRAKSDELHHVKVDRGH